MHAESDPPVGELTELLRRWSDGDRDALDRLAPLVYDELRRIAANYMYRERGGHLLQRTALVHEAFVKLIDQRQANWQNRSHFYALAAQAMRRILVDHARREGRAKRGSGAAKAPLEDAALVALAPGPEPVDAIALDRALEKLEAVDPDAAKIVELRFFVGLTVEEVAELRGISPTSVKREWAVAKSWLYREMAGDRPES